MMYPQFSRGKNDFSVQSIFQKVSCGQGNDSKMRVKWSEEGNNVEFQNQTQLKTMAYQFHDLLKSQGILKIHAVFVKMNSMIPEWSGLWE